MNIASRELISPLLEEEVRETLSDNCLEDLEPGVLVPDNDLQLILLIACYSLQRQPNPNPIPQRFNATNSCLCPFLRLLASSLSLQPLRVSKHIRELVLRVQVVPDGALQLRRALAQHARQVLEVVAGRDAEFADKIFGGGFEVAVVFFLHVVFGPAEVGVGGDGSCAFEACGMC